MCKGKISGGVKLKNRLISRKMKTKCQFIVLHFFQKFALKIGVSIQLNNGYKKLSSAYDEVVAIGGEGGPFPDGQDLWLYEEVVANGGDWG